MQGGGRGAGCRVPPLPCARLFRPLPWIAALAVVLMPACGEGALDRVHDALDVIADAADPAYEAIVVACIATERLTLARTNNEADWESRKGEIRAVCDLAVASFEAARVAQEHARDAIDSCREPSAPCVAAALEAVREAQRAFREASAAWARAKPVLDRYSGEEGP